MPERRPATTRQRTALFDDATRLVHAEYAEDLNLNDVARRIATSRRQLQRIYNEIGKTTFRDQLTQVRMQRAAELLSSNGHTVRAAMPSGARVVLVETLQDARRPDHAASLVDVHMLTQCDGGRQRSVPELQELLRASGLQPGAVHRTAGPALVEGVKP